MNDGVQSIAVNSQPLRRYVAVVEFAIPYDLPENVDRHAVIRAIAEPHNPAHVSSLVKLT